MMGTKVFFHVQFFSWFIFPSLLECDDIHFFSHFAFYLSNYFCHPVFKIHIYYLEVEEEKKWFCFSLSNKKTRIGAFRLFRSLLSLVCYI